MDLKDIAEERFRKGYSCSQSVFSARLNAGILIPLCH